MNEEQTEALYNILMDEKMLLEKEEKRHQEAIENLSKKHLTEWREFFSKKKKV